MLFHILINKHIMLVLISFSDDPDYSLKELLQIYQ
jgi:hypothetical protein